MGYQIGDDGVPGRGRVTTLTNHQSEILHSLILCIITVVNGPHFKLTLTASGP